MDSEVNHAITTRAENLLIIQIHRLATVQAKLTKSLALGWSFSEIKGAYMDLHNIANEIETIETQRLASIAALG